MCNAADLLAKLALRAIRKLSGPEVGIWEVISGVCPPPTDRQSIAQTVLALSE
jgi:hypothetical protein